MRVIIPGKGNMHKVICIKTPPRCGILGRKGREIGEESILVLACLVQAAAYGVNKNTISFPVLAFNINQLIVRASKCYNIIIIAINYIK
jgi:hypothetical protein